MNIRLTLLTIVLAVAAISVSANSAMAKEVSIKNHSKSQVQGDCGGEGDVYWIPGKSGHTYGCMHGDGSGIVCSGVTPKQKQTCSTFRTGSFPSPNLPTRDEVMKAEVTDKK
ncbi:MAG: hypothetical protein WA637_19020 [Terriglobales bacterium]